MKRKNFKLTIAIFLAIMFSAPGNAAPILYSGHYYEIIHTDSGLTWGEAKTLAEGLGGHLATITSANEWNFIQNQYPISSYWLGGYQDPINSLPASENWNWVTGEAWSYYPWCVGEPNDYNNKDEYELMGAGWCGWNDMPLDDKLNDYIVEYDSAPGNTGIPEFPTVALPVIAVIGLMFLFQRRKVK